MDRRRLLAILGSIVGLVVGVVVVAVATMILPFTPIAPAFGLIPMPASVLVPLVGITVLYAVCSELVKRRLWGATASPA